MSRNLLAYLYFLFFGIYFRSIQTFLQNLKQLLITHHSSFQFRIMVGGGLWYRQRLRTRRSAASAPVSVTAAVEYSA